MINKLDFALSLSGGGLSSLAYAGFVEVLKNHHLDPACYAGLSGGAVLAVLIASGFSPSDCLGFFDHLKTFKLINTHLSRLEIIDHNKLILRIRNLLPYKVFEDLPTRTVIFASDLTKKEPVVLQSGDIASAIVAGCSLFPALQPIKRRGLLLGDGGLTVYYGAKYLHELGIKKVIGVDVTGLTEGTVTGFFRALYKQINSSITSNTRYELSEYPVDLDIKISFASPPFFSLDRKANHLIHLGSKAAEKYIHKIKNIVYS